MRRGNGTGSVYKLSGKRRKPWAVVAPATFDDQGKAKRTVIGYYPSRVLAEKALSDYVAAPYDAAGAAKVTFADAFDAVEADAIRDGKESLVEECKLGRKRFAPLMDLLIRDIRFAQIEQTIQGYAHLSYSSRSKMKQLLSRVFKWAIKHDIVVRDYSESIDLGKEPKSTIHTVYTRDEILMLWQNRDDLVSANALVMIYTGLRGGEAVIQPLTDEDKARGWFVAIGNKTDSSKGRIVPIHPAIASILADRKWLIESERFPGRPISYSRLRVQQEVLGHLTHDGRHTCATLMKQYGVEEYARKRILGHIGGNITDDVYTHVGADYLTEQFRKVPSPPDL